MRYVKKMPTTDKSLSKSLILDGWKKLKEPSSLEKSILYSIPLMIFNGAILLVLSFYLYTSFRQVLKSVDEHGFSFSLKLDLHLLIYVFGIFIFTTIHEFLHACFIPNAFKSDKTCWGINAVFGFVYTTERIKKVRFLIISIMPFILLSVILPTILSVLGLLNGYIVFLCLINAMGSSVDLLNLFIVLFWVPKGAYIISNGLESYFK